MGDVCFENGSNIIYIFSMSERFRHPRLADNGISETARIAIECQITPNVRNLVKEIISFSVNAS
jgi:hypothetical protein